MVHGYIGSILGYLVGVTGYLRKFVPCYPEVVPGYPDSIPGRHRTGSTFSLPDSIRPLGLYTRPLHDCPIDLDIDLDSRTSLHQTSIPIVDSDWTILDSIFLISNS